MENVNEALQYASADEVPCNETRTSGHWSDIFLAAPSRGLESRLECSFISDEQPKCVTSGEHQHALSLIQPVDRQLNAIFNSRALSSFKAMDEAATAAPPLSEPQHKNSSSSCRTLRAKRGKAIVSRKRASTSAQETPGGKPLKPPKSRGTGNDRASRRSSIRGSSPNRKPLHDSFRIRVSRAERENGSAKGKTSRSASGAWPPFGTVPERGQTTSLQNTIRAMPMETLFDPADFASRVSVDRIPMSSYFAAALDLAKSTSAGSSVPNPSVIKEAASCLVDVVLSSETQPPKSAVSPGDGLSLTDTITSILDIDVHAALSAKSAGETVKNAFKSIYKMLDRSGGSFSLNRRTADYRNPSSPPSTSTVFQVGTPHEKDKNTGNVSITKKKQTITYPSEEQPYSQFQGPTSGNFHTEISQLQYRTKDAEKFSIDTISAVELDGATQVWPHKKCHSSEKFETSAQADLSRKRSTDGTLQNHNIEESHAFRPAHSGKFMWDARLEGTVAEAKDLIAAVTKVISTASDTIAQAERTIGHGVAISSHEQTAL